MIWNYMKCNYMSRNYMKCYWAGICFFFLLTFFNKLNFLDFFKLIISELNMNSNTYFKKMKFFHDMKYNLKGPIRQLLCYEEVGFFTTLFTPTYAIWLQPWLTFLWTTFDLVYLWYNSSSLLLVSIAAITKNVNLGLI